MDCVICNEETELKENGICLDCQKKICKALGMNIQFLDDEPYVKVTPKIKQPIWDLIQALSNIASNVNYNFHAVKHHTHSQKEIEVVNIE